jgi:peptide chain release factor 1
MFEKKLEAMRRNFLDLEMRISDPDLVKNPANYKKLTVEHSSLREVMDEYAKYLELKKQLADNKALWETEKDPELKAMAKEEVETLTSQVEELTAILKAFLVPKDPLDQKNIIIEIRAGTGGEEAALFAHSLYRMYSRYAEIKKWELEIIDTNETELGGLKEVVFSISGKNVYENMRYESGVHRVQRVPETESSGRIHTSAVTVAVLPEAEETDIEIRNEDLHIETTRASGAGGQHINKTDSAIRMVHIPTGVVVTCQDERSQYKNKAKALKVLRSRLYEMEETKKNSERAQDRKSQVGSGDRSERIRTYNYPQNRVTDHRINMTLYKLEHFMEGEIQEMLDALKVSARQSVMEEDMA